MKRLFFFLVIAVAVVAILLTTDGDKDHSVSLKREIVIPESSQNTLTNTESEAGWILLFNGNDIDSWTLIGDVSSGFRLENGVIVLSGSLVSKSYLISKEKYKDFEVSFQWKVSNKSKGAFLYGVKQAENIFALIYPLIDDIGLQGSSEPCNTTGSLGHIIPSGSKKIKGTGEWNNSKILVLNNEVQHWLNNDVILKYHLDSDTIVKYMEITSRHNYLQSIKRENFSIGFVESEGQIQLRNIKIKPL